MDEHFRQGSVTLTTLAEENWTRDTEGVLIAANFLHWAVVCPY